jgi:hypothetical protein
VNGNAEALSFPRDHIRPKLTGRLQDPISDCFAETDNEQPTFSMDSLANGRKILDHAKKVRILNHHCAHIVIKKLEKRLFIRSAFILLYGIMINSC